MSYKPPELVGRAAASKTARPSSNLGGGAKYLKAEFTIPICLKRNERAHML
jgi:hypothetical protein